MGDLLLEQLLVELKRVPVQPPSSLFLPPSTLLLSVLLGLIVWKERELEGVRERGGEIQKCENV